MLVVASLAACEVTPPRDRAAPPAAAMSQEAYDRWRRPDALVAALAIAPGARVADVGAGDGYLTFRLARAAGPGGLVVATDIDDDALARLREAAARRPAGEARVAVRRVAPASPGLHEGAFDVILLAQVDHLLADRAAYLRALAPALATGGRIAVSNRIQHRARLERDAALAGLRVTPAAVELPGQHLVFLAAEATP